MKKQIIIITTIIIVFATIYHINNLEKTMFSCEGDINSDGRVDYLYIKKEKGRKFLQIDFSGEDIPKKSIEITKLDPQGLQLCNLDGGATEIFVSTKKRTLLHPEVIKRPFFFNIKDGKLIRKWTGSTFGHPYREVFFLDADQDGADEVYTISETEKGEVVRAYYWFTFGFIYLGQSEEYDQVKNIEIKDEQIFARVLKNNKEESVIIKIEEGEF